MESYPPPSAPPSLYTNESRIARSWRLTGAAWRLLRSSRTMLALAFGGLACSVTSCFLVFYFADFFAPASRSGEGLALYGLIAAYPTVFVSVYINVALAYAASAAFDGEKVDLREALDAASSRIRTIAMWSLISVVIGFLLNQIAERVPGGGRLVTWLLGAAWGIGTLFVIPMLAIERTPAVPALRGSVRLAKHRWAEGITGKIAIGAWTGIVAIPAVLMLAIGGAVVETDPAIGVAMLVSGVLVLVATAALSASMNQVFSVALYRHAIDAPAGGFSRWDLENPFTGKPQRKRRKSWILRLGLPFLAGMLVLIVIAGIVGSQRRDQIGDPYWHDTFPAAHAHGLQSGAPITYHGRRVGRVMTTTVEGGWLNVGFQVKPSYNRDLRHQDLRIARTKGGVSIRIVDVGS